MLACSLSRPPLALPPSSLPRHRSISWQWHRRLQKSCNNVTNFSSPDHFHSFLRCAAVGILLSLPVRRPLSSSFSPKCTEKVASSSPGAHELVPLIDALMLVRHYLCMIVDECGFRVAGVTCLYEGIERDAVALMSS